MGKFIGIIMIRFQRNFLLKSNAKKKKNLVSVKRLQTFYFQWNFCNFILYKAIYVILQYNITGEEEKFFFIQNCIHVRQL